MVGTFVTVPFITGYATEDGYGLFAVVTTLASLLAFSDLGIGNGLVTALSRANAAGDADESRRLVSSAAFLLLGVAALLGAVSLVVVPLVDWAGLLGVPAPLADQATPAVAVFAALFLLGIPASLAQKVHLALQEGLAANLWGLAGAALTLLATVACIVTEAGVPWLVASAIGGTTAAFLLNSVVMFRQRPELAPRWSAVEAPAVRSLARAGGLFLVLGTAGAVAYQTDAFVISAILGTAAVTTYVLPLRLFAVPTLLVSFVLTPLWPAYSDAIARRDSAWLKRTLVRSVLLASAVNVPAAVLLCVFGREIIAHWVPEADAPPWLLLVSMALWTALNSVQGPIAMLLNGAGVVGFQVVAATAMALSNIVLSIVLTHQIGVAGPVLGSLVASVVCSLLPSLFIVRRVLRSFA